MFAASPITGKTLIGLQPWFGLNPLLGEDARITGPLAAVWYLIFIIPLFLFTPDSSKGLPLSHAIKIGLNELKGTLHELKNRSALLRFLMARMIYQDGINGLLALGGDGYLWHSIISRGNCRLLLCGKNGCPYRL
jgi:MFS transporter, UMF1 family